MTIILIEDGTDPIVEVLVPQSTVVEVVTAGPPGPPGDSIYEDLDALAAATVPASVIRVYVKSYDAAVGPEGGDWYAETDTEPTHDLWVQDQGGRYWQLDNPAPYLEAGGARGNGSTDDGPAIQRVIDYLEATYGGGTVKHKALAYRIGTALRIKKGVLLEGATPAKASYTGTVTDGATIYDCTTALDPSILIKSDTLGTYVEGGGIVGIHFLGGNGGVRAVEAQTVCGMTFDVWGEKFTDCLLEINGDNGGISFGNNVIKEIYRSGASAACTYSDGLRLNNTTVSRYGFIWNTVREGTGLDIFVTDASSFGHVQGGLQADTDGGRGIILRGSKQERSRRIISQANNGSGAPRFTSRNHRLTSGQTIAMSGWAVATTYNDASVVVTVIDRNTFDVASLTYTAETPPAAAKFFHQVITGNADNGSGKPRFEAVAHGFWNGQSVAMGGWVTATEYNDSNLAITVVDDDHFDITSISYVAEAPTYLTRVSSFTHAARRNEFGVIGGYAPVHMEVSTAVDAYHPTAKAFINGEGLKITYDETASGETGVFDYEVLDWPTGEVFKTRCWPMRDTLEFSTGEATLGAAVTRAVLATGLMPCLTFSATLGAATNYAVWAKAPPHWGTGRLTRARIRYTSNTDGSNAFSIDLRVSAIPIGLAASSGQIGTLHTMALPVSTGNNLIQEHLQTIDEVFNLGDNLLLYIASNGNTDTATVSFSLYSIDLEYVSDGPPDHAPGTLDQTWFPSSDTAPVVTP